MFVAAPHSVASPLAAPVVLGITDPGSSRLVYAMVIGLVLVGVALLVLGIWIIRQTRPDLPVLAPLERMGDRDWRKRDAATQRRMLDELRPEGAEPLATHSPPPTLDEEFEQSDHPVPSLSDLGPGVLAAEGSPSESGERLSDDLESSESVSESVAADDADAAPDDDGELADNEVVDVEVGDGRLDDAEAGVSDDEIADATDDASDVDDEPSVDAAAGPADGADAAADAEQSPVVDGDENVDDVAAEQR